MARPVQDLLDEDDAWPGLLAAISTAPSPVRVLDVDPRRASAVLVHLQVTTRSTLSALAYHCGGLVVGHGWLRILGGGSPDLPDLASANGLDGAEQRGAPPGHLIVAHDVLGGRFAVDGGGLGIDPGQICYWGPDTLSWMGLDVGHTAFVHWALGADGLDEFYASLRWDGWEREVTGLSLAEGVLMLPPPCTTEGRQAPSRHPIPFEELLSFYDYLAAQLAGFEDGRSFRLRLRD